MEHKEVEKEKGYRSACPQCHSLLSELDRLRMDFEEWKVIDRAKWILAMRRNINEQEAHRLLQKFSSQHNKKLLEMAESIIEGEKFLYFRDSRATR